jgi:hypothetical protein
MGRRKVLLVSDDNVFIADSHQIIAGGDNTNQVGELIRDSAEQFAEKTAFDWEDPPWGKDEYGNQYAPTYIPVHADFRDAYTAFGNSLMAAAQMTINSGKGFRSAQEQAIDDIRSGGGRR